MDQKEDGILTATQKQWESIYFLGGIAGVVTLAGILLDLLIGTITGGNLTTLPQTAADRFIQFHDNQSLGLYNLDFINIIVQIVFVPAWFALYGAHRQYSKPYALLALIVFLFGSILLVSDNTALSMLELSNKFYSAPNEEQKAIYTAAGEALLAMGAHGSKGIFLGFLIPNIGGLMMSVVMLNGRIFSKVNAWTGILGNFLMILYILSVTFIPGVDKMATAFAMPGGLLLMAWILMFTLKLFRLARK